MTHCRKTTPHNRTANKGVRLYTSGTKYVFDKCIEFLQPVKPERETDNNYYACFRFCQGYPLWEIDLCVPDIVLFPVAVCDVYVVV